MSHEPMKEEDLKTLRASCQSVTEGPWKISHFSMAGKERSIIEIGPFEISIENFGLSKELSFTELYDICFFICASRNFMPELLNEIEHLRTENEGLRQLNTAMKTVSTQRVSRRGCRP